MNNFEKYFPWFLFVKILKAFLTTLSFVLISNYFLSNHTFLADLIIVLTSLILFSTLLFYLLKPFNQINQELSILLDKIKHEDKLKNYYHKNDWVHLKTALAYTKKIIEGQEQIIQSESNKMNLLLETIDDAIIAVDLELNILFKNKFFDQLFHLTNSPIENKIKVWTLIQDPDVLNLIKVTLTSQKSSQILTYHVQLNGQSQYFDLKIFPLMSQSESIGAVAVFHNMTDRKLLDQMRGDFIANISHEIRTPLTSIQGFSQILSQSSQNLNEEQTLSISKIQKNADRMLSLFNDLLQLSFIESKNKLFKTSIKLEELFNNIYLNLKAIYPEKIISLHMNLQIASLNGDEKLIERALMNLIDNACKYGHKTINLHITSFQKNQFIYLTIQDDGPGIAAEHLPRIFERFYRVDSSRENQRGTGLGLSIVKHIIQKHHGEIQVESQLNHGTTFKLILPA